MEGAEEGELPAKSIEPWHPVGGQAGLREVIEGRPMEGVEEEEVVLAVERKLPVPQRRADELTAEGEGDGPEPAGGGGSEPVG
jgi:hypothetical protein